MSSKLPTILLVDDDELLSTLINTMLQNAGFQVSRANTGEHALTVLAKLEAPPDLAVLDISMPGMSGLTLARLLDPIPCMFISGRDDPEIVEQATNAGAMGFLVKPIDPSRLLPSIRAGLARAEEMRSLREAEVRMSQSLKDGRETGMAVGLLMERFQLGRHDALRLLREHARSSQRKLNDVAIELLDAAEVLNRYGSHSRK